VAVPGSNAYAIEPGTATSVVLSGLEIRNYVPGNQHAAIATNQSATGWVLQNLQVHDNGNSSGGDGVNVGIGWQVLGGRYYNNRQAGLISGIGVGAVINGAEIDHNNFRDNSYLARNIDCGTEAGGFKWVSNNMTVVNSSVHDNACAGLWMDIHSQTATISNNRVYNNWDEGILIEISSGASITGNTVYGNGFRSFRGSCASLWVFGAGIMLSESADSVVANNTVSGNCNGITGAQENRPAPSTLQNDSFHDNTVSGPGGKFGVGSYPNISLAGRNITFANNSVSGGVTFCGLACNSL